MVRIKLSIVIYFILMLMHLPCSRRGGLGSQRKRLSLLVLLWGRESLFLVLLTFLRHSMTLSLYVVTNGSIILYCLITFSQIVRDLFLDCSTWLICLEGKPWFVLLVSTISFHRVGLFKSEYLGAWLDMLLRSC